MGAFLMAAGMAAGMGLILTPLCRLLAFRIGAVDSPEARKIHQSPMPRLGGLAIYLGFSPAFWFLAKGSPSLWGLWLGGTLIFLVGLVDDIKNLHPLAKLMGQVLAALVAVAWGVKVEFLTNPFDGLFVLGNLAIPVTLFWIVGITNALNLIDGLDGLAAGTAAIAGITIGIIAALRGEVLVAGLALSLAASSLGFLPYNFHPARIFMGDCGSMFLGYNLAVLAILGLTKGATVVSLFIPIVVLGLPIMDTLMAIFRRFLNKRPIFSPDRGHIHHKLLDQGLDQRQAVGIIYLVNACLGGSAIILSRLTTAQGTWLLVGLGLLGLFACERLGLLGKDLLRRVKARCRSTLHLF